MYKYTGMADHLINGRTGKEYARKPVGNQLPFDRVDFTPVEAAHLMSQSDLHSFEDAGVDLMEKMTAPATMKEDNK